MLECPREEGGPRTRLAALNRVILLLFLHNCSFQRSFYSTLIDLQWSPTKLVSNLGRWSWKKKTFFLSKLPNNPGKLYFLLTFKTIQFRLMSQTFNYVIFQLPFFMFFFSLSVVLNVFGHSVLFDSYL